MRKIYLLGLALFIMFSSLNAQSSLRVLEGMGTRLYDINDSGNALHPGGYYDYTTNTSSSVEAGSGAQSTNKLNNAGDVAGTMAFVAEDGSNLDQAAYRKNGTWTAIGFYPGDVPGNSWFGNSSAISENSKYITGIISVSPGSSYPFIFDTETSTLTKLTGDNLYESGRGYGVNDSGIVAAWIDRDDIFNTGTFRVPAYFDAEGMVHYIDFDTPEYGESNDVNNAGQVVGYKSNKAFIYDINTGVYQSFTAPDGSAAVFTSVSDNGIAIGYSDDLGTREVIIYHPSLGDAPIFLKDLLIAEGVTITTFDGKLGTGMGISPDGKFICGFDNTAPIFFAAGWVVYLDIEIGEPTEGNCDLEGELADPALGGPVWDRPLEGGGGMSSVGIGVSYHVYGPFTVDTNGAYEINSTQDGWDGFILVYQDNFDPMDPLTNHVASDDDGPDGIGTSQVIPNLVTGTEYFLVTTAFSPEDFGMFVNTITGPGTVTCNGSEPAEGCLDAENGQYPTGAAFVPACNGAAETITSAAWTGEYSLVQVQNGEEYIFSVSDPTYFITIGDAAGTTVITSGTGSVTWTANMSGDVRFYAHFNSDCDWDAETFFSRMVQCGEVPPPPSDCEDYEVLSNNLENGLFFGGDTAQHLATDIPVGDTGFTIYGMEPTVIGEATSFEFIIYSDAAGLPGTELDTRTGAIVDSEVTGNNFGFDFIKYTVGFDSPLALDANTTYWIEIISDAGGWESTSVSGIGHGDVFYNSNVGEGVWTSTGGDEMVFNLICSELGVSDMNSFDFAYYPNPVKDELNITSQKVVQSVSVYNLAGQQISTQKLNVNNGKVSTSSLPAGVYVFRAVLEGGQIETFKVIKK